VDYYHLVRREIMPLLPGNATRILEVGAGAGATLKWLKSLYPVTETTAVEVNPTLLDELKQNADVVIVGPIDETFAQLKTYEATDAGAKLSFRFQTSPTLAFLFPFCCSVVSTIRRRVFWIAHISDTSSKIPRLNFSMMRI
jgi:hypothetical protein